MKVIDKILPKNCNCKSNRELLLFLDLGNLEGQKGKNQAAIDYYMKGLQIAREMNDLAQIQNLSNLILTYL